VVVCATVCVMRVFVTEKQPARVLTGSERNDGGARVGQRVSGRAAFPHVSVLFERQSCDKKSQRHLIYFHTPQQHTSFTMGNPSAKRKRPEGMGYRKPKKLVKKFKKQKEYHSDSEDDDQVEQVTTTTTTTTTTDFKPVNMDDSDDEEIEDAPAATTAPVAASEPVIEKKVIEKVIEKKVTPKPAAPAKAEPAPAVVQPKLKFALKQSKKADPPSESEESDEDEEEEDEDDDDVEDLDALDDEDLDDSDLEDDDELDLEDDGEGGPKKTRKRNDPTAFATSMSKILGTKLTTAKRQDPVLSRSAAATAASKELADQKLEMKAKRKMHAEKREALDKGRVKDVLGLNTPEVSTAEIQETERRLQKTAQRGVVKLFNAVRAAQVQGETARSEAKKEGVIGISQREERVSEMSKKGFLDLIATGGKKPAAIEA
jgi:fusion and transport protein UGO1